VSSVSAAGGSSAPGEVHAAIARAAQATGVDFGYLLAQAKLESGLDPSAKARTSSATGLYQFTGSTWLRTLDRHGAEHGLDWASAAIDGGKVRDPAARAQIMALRQDPQLSALMAGELASDNRADLTGALGRAPDNAELYLAHFLGSEGASRFLAALSADPGQSAAAILPKAAGANRAIFFDGGAPRSVGQVMDLLRARLDAATPAGGMDLPLDTSTFAAAPAVNPSQPTFTGGPVQREFQAVAYSAQGPERASMADTLRDTFGIGQGGAAPDSVRAAYGRLRAFGM